MNQCKKIKHPCKICFDSVSKKNGVQCQGACQKWAHYKCLNYTPGKIQDIKAGVIKITCPCPDCNTTQPKEVLVNPPFSCTNSKCPANQLPVCKSLECPSNENPIPFYPAPPAYSTSSNIAYPHTTIAQIHSRCSGSTIPAQRSISYSSVIVPSGNPYNTAKTTSSASAMPKVEDQQALLSAIQNIANTVGQLSKQLNDIKQKIIK